jgi:hypothetical protein
MGAISGFHFCGLVGRSDFGSGAPLCTDTASVAGTALDPDSISGSGGYYGDKLAGSHRNFVVLGPDCTRRIFIPVLTYCSNRVVRDSLAGKASGVTVIKLDF